MAVVARVLRSMVLSALLPLSRRFLQPKGSDRNKGVQIAEICLSRFS